MKNLLGQLPATNLQTKERTTEFKWQFFGLLNILKTKVDETSAKKIAESIADLIIEFDKSQEEEEKKEVENFDDYFNKRFA